jgi:hypothetical protein
MKACIARWIEEQEELSENMKTSLATYTRKKKRY